MRMRGLVVVVVLVALIAACQRKDTADKQPAAVVTTQLTPRTSGSASAPPTRSKIEQVAPPFDIKTPPADATTTGTGLIYKKLVAMPSGDMPKRNDTVMIQFTGWSQSTGETFNTTRTRGQPQPMPLSTAGPGFVEGLQLMTKGERFMLWIPPSLGSHTPTTSKTPETLVFEVELIEIVRAPAIPPDVAAPPVTAKTLASGTKYLVVRPGTGKDRPRSFDTVEFNYSAWDPDGRMFESTEGHKRPQSAPPYKQSVALEEVLTAMTVGQRTRFWATPARPVTSAAGSRGLVCYELELVKITKGHQPPPVPTDVAAAPADAKQTAAGVRYKVLVAGKGGVHPAVTDRVKLHYTGWTSAGRMFESSVVRNEPTEFALASGVIRGWADGIPMMSVGDKVRFWIPEELAYKSSPGRPQGMLVFDIELLEILPPRPPRARP